MLKKKDPSLCFGMAEIRLGMTKICHFEHNGKSGNLSFSEAMEFLFMNVSFFSARVYQ
uniref:Uncharacterized protein n=1 Tax=Candidatus Kentrum sp. MB TaxID=2138164 RepID=A0A451B8V7_9GAMM|nr:MAG: hypothetical protein BECKMB1821G_GA0114241_102322 [Candidatus Kentron sp. MB]VFK29272.1 MAG: hypothetical protein BECKMB1821I_GA0114274_10099 [Candidatus Kentron sp. MB]VFK74724.1 MAG: hypothetical protein BECKMB1821H_GA0114242_10099 [Candidatus Kentron sp. MB]